MGFLDKAKKLAEQAMDKAQEVAADVKARQAQQQTTFGDAPPPPPPPGGGYAPPPPPPGSSPRPRSNDPRPPLARQTGAGPGTPYTPGMLGRPGWRERDLVDPAGVLPIRDRMAAGVPQSTKSEILEQAFGMGRRWSGGGRTAGLYYQLYPEQAGWEPGSGTTPYPGVPGAKLASLPDGRTLVFLPGPTAPAVLESQGIDDAARDSLARAAAKELAEV